jgi:hypothetical protein
LGWREEVDVVLREWIASEGGGKGGRRWQRVGRAWSGSEPGQYLVDIRSVKLTADQSDDLCLAGPGKESIPGGFRVMDARFEGEVLRLRVAEHANPPDAYLWWQNQEPAFLIKKLREGIAGLADAGLATLLAQGNPGGMLSGAAPPRWLQGGQEHAYRACGPAHLVRRAEPQSAPGLAMAVTTCLGRGTGHCLARTRTAHRKPGGAPPSGP